MASLKGRTERKRFIAAVPGEVKKVLRGAVREAAKVVAEEAKVRVVSDKVRDAIKVSTKADEGRVIAKVQVRMGGYNLPLWLEYGTDPHFISVDASQRGGMGIRRINDETRKGTLVINGKPVGATVWHPGARAHPFMRPALDAKEGEARNAAQAYINSRIGKAGIRADDIGDEA